MSTFVEVFNNEKHCKVIINLDQVTEIAPVAIGGCHVFLANGQILKVSDEYTMFTQFALQTVSSDMIKDRVAKLTGKKATAEA